MLTIPANVLSDPNKPKPTPEIGTTPSQYSRLSDNLIQSVDVTRYYDGFEFYDRNLTEGKYYFGNGYVSFHPGDSVDYSAIIIDYRGSTRVVMTLDSTLSTSNIVQANSYYPSGALVTDVQTSIQLGSTSGDVQTHKFLGKELDRMYGLDRYDLGARRYDAAAVTFWTMDPLCEQYYHINPYAYCTGDPVNKIDPDGQRIFITGNHANDALFQFQSIVGDVIKLSFNKDGSLAYEKQSADELKSYSLILASIIDDPRTDVILGTRDSYGTSTGKYFSGGAFMGNRVEKDQDGIVTRVITNQEIYAEALSGADTYVKLGTSIKHELTESYEGAKMAWKKGKSIPSADVKMRFYKRAHRRASPQPPYLDKRLIDAYGNIITDPALQHEAVKEEYYVKPSRYSIEEKYF